MPTKMESGVCMSSEAVGDNYPWMKDALCQGMSDGEDDFFYDKYERKPKIRPFVDEICNHCPVRKQCLLRGSEGEYGVWGGVFWDGNGRPDKERNKHKTPEDWERIRNGV